MSFENILQHIGKYVPFTCEEKEAFCSVLSIKTLSKKEYLLREGDICLYEYYVNKGCLRSFYIDKTGMEHNFYFAIEDWWTSEMHSRMYHAPSFYNIMAIEDCELVQISQVHLEQFLKNHPKFEHFFRVLYQRSLAWNQVRFVQMLHLNAEERYEHFRKKYPQFDNRVPQKHIATFLGLTPEFFSTVRSKVLRKKKGSA